MRVCGIDPGVNGAIAFLLNEAGVTSFDIPTFTVKKGKKNRSFVNASAVASLLSHHSPQHIYIEETITMPKESALGAHTSGRAFGVIEGVAAAQGIPITIVSANVWKKALGLSRDKELSRQRASQLFPDAADLWPYKKDADRAEAVLIAEYGRKDLEGIL